MNAHEPAVDAAPVAAGCPFHALEALPGDGTLLAPSPRLAEMRAESPATPLQYTGDRVGWMVTGYELAKQVLGDERFSIESTQLPVGGRTDPAFDVSDIESLLDADAIESLRVANVLALDAPQHDKVRRAMISRFMVKAVRGREDEVRSIVERQLSRLKSLPSPADVTAHYAHPISAYVHCVILGVPETMVESYVEGYEGSSAQEQFDFVRRALAEKAGNLADDALSDLIRSDLSEHEKVGAAWILVSVGRDNVARMIATMTVALLKDPGQLALLRADPDLTAGAVEEIVRYGSPFVGLFVREATEDVTIGGVTFEAGQAVSVSAVGANRDPSRFEHPDEFDVTRDAFGHLGFGFGDHSCVGQQLARVEIREAIRALIIGIPTLQLVSAEQLEPMPFTHPVGMHDTGSVVVSW